MTMPTIKNLLCILLCGLIPGISSGQGWLEDPEWVALHTGIESLQNGAPFDKVLEQWDAALTRFPQGYYSSSLKEYTATLRKQVAEQTVPPTLPPGAPRALTVRQRVDYYVALLPEVDVRDTGTSGWCDPTDAPTCQALIKIGHPAVPLLIRHLTDCRLTRTVCSPMSQYPTIMRVQDVALRCLQTILKKQFVYTDLSRLESVHQVQIVHNIVSWWKRHTFEAQGMSAADRREQRLLEATQRYPDSTAAHLKLATFYMDAHRYLAAEMEDRRAIRIDPNSAEAHRALAGVAVAQRYTTPNDWHYFSYSGNRVKLAEHEYKRAAQLRPNDAGLHKALGDAYVLEEWGNTGGSQPPSYWYPSQIQAKQEYDRAVQLDPNDAMTHKALADLYAGHIGLCYSYTNDSGKTSGSQEDFAAALSEYKQVIRLNPSDASAHEALGAAYWKHRQVSEAEPEFNRAIQLRPRDAALHERVADFYYLVGTASSFFAGNPGPTECELSSFVLSNYGLAAREYRTALKLAPQPALARERLADCYCKLKDWDHAEQVYKTVLATRPKDAYLHDELGRVYNAQQRTADAIREYREALRLAPTNPDAHTHLGELYMAQNSYSEAETEFRQATDKMGLGRLYARQKRYAEAEQIFKQSAKDYPQNPDPHTNQGRCMPRRTGLSTLFANIKVRCGSTPAIPWRRPTWALC